MKSLSALIAIAVWAAPASADTFCSYRQPDGCADRIDFADDGTVTFTFFKDVQQGREAPTDPNLTYRTVEDETGNVIVRFRRLDDDRLILSVPGDSWIALVIYRRPKP